MMDVEALVPEPAVEALDEAVLHRMPRPNEVQRDAPLRRLVVERLRHEFRPVVAHDHVRQSADQLQPLQRVHDPHGRQRALDQQHGTFPRGIIDHGPDTKGASIDQRVAHEVHARL